MPSRLNKSMCWAAGVGSTFQVGPYAMPRGNACDAVRSDVCILQGMAITWLSRRLHPPRGRVHSSIRDTQRGTLAACASEGPCVSAPSTSMLTARASPRLHWLIRQLSVKHLLLNKRAQPSKARHDPHKTLALKGAIFWDTSPAQASLQSCGESGGR